MTEWWDEAVQSEYAYQLLQLLWHSPRATARTGPGLASTAYARIFSTGINMPMVLRRTLVTAFILGTAVFWNVWLLSSSNVQARGIMLIPALPAALMTAIKEKRSRTLSLIFFGVLTSVV